MSFSFLLSGVVQFWLRQWAKCPKLSMHFVDQIKGQLLWQLEHSTTWTFLLFLATPNMWAQVFLVLLLFDHGLLLNYGLLDVDISLSVKWSSKQRKVQCCKIKKGICLTKMFSFSDFSHLNVSVCLTNLNITTVNTNAALNDHSIQ